MQSLSQDVCQREPNASHNENWNKWVDKFRKDYVFCAIAKVKTALKRPFSVNKSDNLLKNFLIKVSRTCKLFNLLHHVFQINYQKSQVFVKSRS